MKTFHPEPPKALYKWENTWPEIPWESDTTVRRSAVDQEDIPPYWKEEKCHIAPGDPQFYFFFSRGKLVGR